jgi:cytoskeletal protein CcmA (bactofilin family)
MADDMKIRCGATILVVAVFLVLFAAPAVALMPFVSADRAGADLVLVQNDDVVTEDLYAVGNRIVIEGTVEGDVLAAATGELLITGHVEGNVTGVASSIVISGSVDGSVRVAAGTVRVDGQVGGDLFVGAANLIMTGDIGRDLLSWTISLETTGTVGRDVAGQSFGMAKIGGMVGGDVDLTTNRLTVLDGTNVTGTLGYRSSNDAVIGQGVQVGRQIVHREPVRPNVRVEAVFALTKLVAVLTIIIVGFLLFWASPRSLDRAVRSVRTFPFRTLLLGVAAAVLPPVVIVGAAGLAFAASSEFVIPALVVGGPIAATIFGLIALGLLLAPIPVLTAVGGKLLGWRRSGQAGFLVGAILWVVFLLIPVVGIIVLVVTALLGLGAWTYALLAGEGEPDRPAGATAEPLEAPGVETIPQPELFPPPE